MSGRLLAVGDIHGCHIAFDTLLDRLSLGADDELVVLGDVVDRGPGTRQVVERLLELESSCKLRFLLGNHEEMMLDAHAGGEWSRSWLEYGGREALDSYGGSFDDVPEEHLDFLRRGLGHLESPREIFVHANLRARLPLDRQSAHWLRWVHLRGDERPHPSGRRIVCGHTSQKNGLPLVFDGWVCIDTFAHGGQFLTCLDCGTDRLHQTNQSGAYRAFDLADVPRGVH